MVTITWEVPGVQQQSNPNECYQIFYDSCQSILRSDTKVLMEWSFGVFFKPI